ncbi:MAG TPA: septal ring lytic transglycosylase RlpA family protein [Solirubrobacteraceae bacterium]|nr:septal ring lytic transglycosylase RlpA family protein [Solirubrobacteraceae bacterium]
MLCLPAPALAASGGSGLSPASGMSPSSGAAPAPAPANTPVTASGNGITLTTTASALLRNALSFTGTAPTGSGVQTVEIERLGHQTHWRWQPTVQATINADGSFDAVWRTNHIGRFLIRAVLGGTAASAAQADTAPTVATTIYRPSVATLYGPGFYGRRTACGRRLTRSMIGVANRTLPCGSTVAIDYHGRTLQVPVIDRGPYANHADWDLTMATARAIGITGTVKLGAVSLPTPPPSAPAAAAPTSGS